MNIQKKYKKHSAKIIFSFLILINASLVIGQQSRIKICINPGWRFKLGDSMDKPYSVNYNDSTWDFVSIPHTHEIFNVNLNNFWDYGRNIGWYRREIQVSPEWIGKKIFLEFQGVMQTNRLWVNGTYVGEYAVSGYDSQLI